MTEREIGYLCTFETRGGDALVIHQYAPHREGLFKHISQMMMREPYRLKTSHPAFYRDDLRLVSVVPADFIPAPAELLAFKMEQGDD